MENALDVSNYHIHYLLVMEVQENSYLVSNFSQLLYWTEVHGVYNGIHNHLDQ